MNYSRNGILHCLGWGAKKVPKTVTAAGKEFDIPFGMCHNVLRCPALFGERRGPARSEYYSSYPCTRHTTDGGCVMPISKSSQAEALNLSAAAKYLGVGRTTLYHMINRGDLVPVRVGSTSIRRILRRDLDALCIREEEPFRKPQK